MVTNPNTLGVFERNIQAIAAAVHDAGGLALLRRRQHERAHGRRQAGRHGRRRHAVQSAQDVLDAARRRRPRRRARSPCPSASSRICRSRASSRDASGWRWSEDFPHAIGRVRSFHGNFGMLVRAYCYMRTLGAEGLTRRDRDGRAERQLPPSAARAASLPLAFDDAVAARVRVHRPRPRRAPASTRSTSPSACSTTASTRRRSTSRWSCRARS